MRKIRTILGWVAIALLISANIYLSWSSERSLEKQELQASERNFSIEERMLLFQVKALLGSKDLLSSYQKEAPELFSPPITATYKEALKDIQEQVLNSELVHTDQIGSRYILREKAIFAARVNEFEKSAEIINLLKKTDRESNEFYLDDLLEKIFSANQNGEVYPLSPTDLAVINGELLDFAVLVNVERSSEGLVLPADVREQLKEKATRFLTGAILFLVVICFSFIFFLLYLWLFITGRAKFLFRNSELPANYPVETFALYLLAMTLAPKVLGYLVSRGMIENILIANVIFILCTLFVIFWPVVCLQSFREMRKAFGLYLGTFGAFLRSLIIAPTFYLASWTVFAGVLVMYGFLLDYLKVDVSQGAHPIVPLLLSSKDENASLLIALLATAVAPLIEEIMFRGALYSGLRNHMSALFAIPISALLFASIHPQGAIGLVPLTFIGILLAFLREWRGSLLAPMIAHACVNGGTLIMVTLLLKDV